MTFCWNKFKKLQLSKKVSQALSESEVSFESEFPDAVSSRGFLREGCSENIQQICRRTPMPRCDFDRVAHFGMSVPLYICCIFSECFSWEHVWCAASNFITKSCLWWPFCIPCRISVIWLNKRYPFIYLIFVITAVQIAKKMFRKSKVK